MLHKLLFKVFLNSSFKKIKSNNSIYIPTEVYYRLFVFATFARKALFPSEGKGHDDDICT